MKNISRLTLVMLVVPPDMPIARYTIPALKRFTEIFDVEVIIYMNGLSPADEAEVKNISEGLKGIKLKSNKYSLLSKHVNMVRGKMYVTESGRIAFCQGPFESSVEVWERELLLMKSELVGIIDADFEVLDGRFVWEIFNSFNNDSKLGFMSVEFSPTRYTYETYSKRYGILWERYHTWFCVYKSKALKLCSDFSYFEENSDGTVVMYDHSANLQKILKKFGYHGAVVGKIWDNSFMHYGLLQKIFL